MFLDVTLDSKKLELDSTVSSFGRCLISNQAETEFLKLNDIQNMNRSIQTLRIENARIAASLSTQTLLCRRTTSLLFVSIGLEQFFQSRT